LKLLLKVPDKKLHSKISITGSKSESNRLLLLQAIFPELKIANLSNSDDTKLMQAALKEEGEIIDIHHAGTAMRFLTSFLAIDKGRQVTLTGSQRMQERPVKILVDALRSLGASIEYLKEEGYPPLQINGQKLQKNEVAMKANVSSQYLSSILLIGAALEKGIILTLEGEITSLPYLKMTIALLKEIGVRCDFFGNQIRIYPVKSITKTEMVVESDWSSASYFYSLAALAEEATIKLSSYKKQSLQGDSVLAEIYRFFGVRTIFEGHSITLVKEKKELHNEKKDLVLDLTKAPDIAQTIAVSCFGAGKGCQLSGLHTLKIKETDRLEALKSELTKLGAAIEVNDKELILQPSKKINANIAIDTYNDHRMAMAFAPLALKTNIIINDAKVVSKSYPDFWEDMKQIGFQIITLEA
jgi:3-phosphoshikimate 1-carboxyvinyltransferase